MGIVRLFDNELFEFEQKLIEPVRDRISKNLFPGIIKKIEKGHKISNLIYGAVTAAGVGIVGAMAVGFPYLIYQRQYKLESPVDYLFLAGVEIGVCLYGKDIISAIRHNIRHLVDYHEDIQRESEEFLGSVVKLTAHNLAEKTIVGLYTKNLEGDGRYPSVTHFSHN